MKKIITLIVIAILSFIGLKIYDIPQKISDTVSPAGVLDGVVSYVGIQDSIARDIIKKNIQTLRERLKNNQTVDDWIALGTQYKIAGDIEKAKLAWKEAVQLNPKSSVALSNLADLYGYYIKDTGKAEEYFKRAVQAAPQDIALYFSASDFYTQVLNNKDKAQEMIKQGIKNNPQKVEALKQKLNSLIPVIQ